MSENPQVAAVGAFDNPTSATLRFLQEAMRLGEVTAFLWPDETITRLTGKSPWFPAAEREYFLRSLRYVKQVFPVEKDFVPGTLPGVSGFTPDLWALNENQLGEKELCRKNGWRCQVIDSGQTAGFPVEPSRVSAPPGRKKVVVTGAFDWLHSGHVRFFEEACALGDLYVVVGHDANIRLLKGAGHPLFSGQERCYMVHSIRFVTEALLSSGDGWLDAAPEIQKIQPDIYAVNEDGDKGGKREFCHQHGIEYRVLKRAPAPGLPIRSSTTLRGF